MEKVSQKEFMRLRKLVFRNARPLDYTMWNCLFEGGSSAAYLAVLSSYQNEDGGFGHNIECNNWNPHSSPYTVCIALDYLDVLENVPSGAGSIVHGILQYLASGAYANEDGWVGMQGVPSNNDFAHLPWFHFDPSKKATADVGVTKRLSDFILQYSTEGTALHRKALVLKEKYRHNGAVLLDGVPDLDPSTMDMKAFCAETWPFWIPLPVYFVGSPQNALYAELKDIVAQNLDAIVQDLRGANEIPFPSVEELLAFEQNNPHPEGKRWCVPEQTIGNYYWGSHHIVRKLDTLRKFGRLDFSLPVRV